jgi:2-(1,2-epoxy-1,2-dihydrophenyl)acetyl-CoA isomerase
MQKDSDGSVLSTVEGNIGNIVFNRPECLNAFNLDLAKRFLRTLNSFRKNMTVRVVVIKGAGSVFSAGGDVKEMLSDVTGGKDRAAFFRSALAMFNRMVLSITRIPKPVLAVVHGAVAGVAFNLMLACDLTIAREETIFTQAFVKIGLSPDGGGTYFLPRLIGHARACELTMLPTKINAETALNWGLINWIVPAVAFEDKVRKIAGELADGPALAIGRTKSLLNQSFRNSLAQQMKVERLAQIQNSASEDFSEGLKAFTEKRKPRFCNLQSKHT